ncbi:MAG TPA: hypothetical protein VIA06_10015, partial [Candidatus Dormibacteraeota bacterium]|nr:hypothetical protein [Candidatus Dormibacteraeota bacterium]
MGLVSERREEEATGFQESAAYDESIDLRTDFVMAYGVDETLPARIRRWRERGYRVHLMTGVSWGQYQDYLYGRFDGREHWDEAQTTANGRPILHGKDVPYMVPTLSFQRYLIEKLRGVVALGVEAIHLEEPEFWSRAGYSDAFKREWLAYHGEEWQEPHASVEGHYRSGKLKRYLLTRCMDGLFGALRDEAVRQGRWVRLYVPTHTLLNYTQWQIVSPESALRQIPTCDGCIAQVWTGTARTPNVYAGVAATRTFETAFLEYGIAQDLTRGTDRRLWFLHDPIEDHPQRTWEDYRANYQRTVVASLLHPGISRYEVAPWPYRIYNRPYRTEAGGDERSPISTRYATELQISMQTLRDMDQDRIRWEHGGPGIGLLLSDSAMFQRWLPEGGAQGHYDGLQSALDPEQVTQLRFSPFYGLAMPMLKQGQPITPVQLENLADTPGALDGYQILLLSYEFMKPLSATVHHALAGWVRGGGGLLYVGDGSDSYHAVREWWNQGARRYPTAAHHLFEVLGADLDGEGVQRVSEGAIRVLPVPPASLTDSAAAAETLVAAARGLIETRGYAWRPSNRLALRRGPSL